MSRQPKPSFPFAPGGAVLTRFPSHEFSQAAPSGSNREVAGRHHRPHNVFARLRCGRSESAGRDRRSQRHSSPPSRGRAGERSESAALQPVPPSAQARPTRSPLRNYPSPPPRAGRGNSSARPTPTRAPGSGGDDTGEWLRSGPRPHPRSTPIRHGGPRGTPPPHETATPSKSAGTMIGDAGPPRNFTPIPTPPLVRGQFQSAPIPEPTEPALKPTDPTPTPRSSATPRWRDWSIRAKPSPGTKSGAGSAESSDGSAGETVSPTPASRLFPTPTPKFIPPPPASDRSAEAQGLQQLDAGPGVPGRESADFGTCHQHQGDRGDRGTKSSAAPPPREVKHRRAPWDARQSQGASDTSGPKTGGIKPPPSPTPASASFSAERKAETTRHRALRSAASAPIQRDTAARQLSRHDNAWILKRRSFQSSFEKQIKHPSKSYENKTTVRDHGLPGRLSLGRFGAGATA